MALLVTRYSLPVTFLRAWHRFFPAQKTRASLGQKLKNERLLQDLSTSKVATALDLQETVILALEEDHFLEPGYARLIAVHYARLLGIELSAVLPLLPPPAPLHRPGQTFITNLSHLESKPGPRHFVRQQQELTYSFRNLIKPLAKLVLTIVILISLFYFWNILRHLGRVL